MVVRDGVSPLRRGHSAYFEGLAVGLARVHHVVVPVHAAGMT